MYLLISLWIVLSVSIDLNAAPAQPIDDLQIELQNDSLLLTWSEPENDLFGNPVQVDGYRIYLWQLPYFDFESGILQAEVTDTCYFFTDPDGWFPIAFFQVTALGGTPIPEGMVPVPAGTFTMGQEGVAEPLHEVTLTADIYLSRYEITNQQYLEAVQWAYDNGYVSADSNTVQAYGYTLLVLMYEDCEIEFSDGIFSLVMRTHTHDNGSWGPGHAYPTGYDPAEHPVKMVTWYGAACYCDWRSEIEGLIPFYQGDWDQTSEHNPYDAEGYRLPTEAEWEYAARYNDGRAFPWGNETPTPCIQANFSHCLGWTAPIGSYPPGTTQLELADIGGNEWEWTGDYWDSEYYSSSPTINPLGPSSGARRILRGSDFGSSATTLNCSFRHHGNPVDAGVSVGIRICRTANP